MLWWRGQKLREDTWNMHQRVLMMNYHRFVISEYVNRKQADAFLLSFRLTLHQSAAPQQVCRGRRKRITVNCFWQENRKTTREMKMRGEWSTYWSVLRRQIASCSRQRDNSETTLAVCSGQMWKQGSHLKASHFQPTPLPRCTKYERALL